ncbi:MAG: hypothetical protein ACFCUE_14000 [Candidatus Bathyarchaeia archaeon]|jgi:hypothetical protein
MRKPFKESDKQKMLLWSGRCCCLCGKSCGSAIEIAHIDQKAEKNNDIDNGIPVCHDHHIEIGRYNDEHPLGDKYRVKELKMLRDQAYEKHTQHLVPDVNFQMTQVLRDNPSLPLRKFPNVGTRIQTSSPAARAKIEIKTIINGKSKGIMKDSAGYYSGETIWNLKANSIFWGNFTVELKDSKLKKDLKLEVRVTLIDNYEREHILPIHCWTYV